ncbi:flagellar motor protein MotA [Mycobacteroides abscessus subsp. abscessus]|nr:flagellar motor protein MotA [Mycobacteroides abscessus subsp. abscessus]
MIEGVLSILEGEAPRVIEQKLASYLPAGERKQFLDSTKHSMAGQASLISPARCLMAPCSLQMKQRLRIKRKSRKLPLLPAVLKKARMR